MNIPNKLRKELVDFIQAIPNIHSDEAKRSLLLSAGLDTRLLNQIVIAQPLKPFLEILISTLYEYGHLEDGRDPITALLLEANELLGLDCDGNRKGDRLISSWKQFLSKKDALSNISMTPERLFYLENLLADVSELKMSRISADDQGDPILLSNVYVDVETNVQLHLSIHNYHIDDWWISSISPDDHSELFTFSRSNSEGYDTQAVELIVREAQDFIRGEDGNISPLEKDRPLIYRPFWDDGIKRNYYTLGSLDVAASSNRLVLVGEPGSGKSTFAQFLTLSLAKQQLSAHENGFSDKISKWPHGPLTPVSIDIRKFVDREDFPDVDTPITIEYFWEYISTAILDRWSQDFAGELRRDFISGRVLVIFDGLDEAFAPIKVVNGQEKRIRQLYELAKSLSKKFRSIRIIFTTRPHEFAIVQSDFVKCGYQIARMEKLQSNQMVMLATNIYRSIGLPQVDAEKKANQLRKELEPVAEFLKNRPLFLTLMVMLSLNPKTKRLPTKRGSLLHQSVFLLIDRWTRTRTPATSSQYLRDEDTREIFNSLENIAHRAQDHVSTVREQTVSLPIGDIYAEFSGFEHRIFEIVNYLTKQAGILDLVGLDSYGKELYKFAHRSFQEFLAASYLVKKGDFSVIRTKVEKAHLQWREPCILIGDLLSEKGAKLLWELIHELVGSDYTEELLSDPSHWHSIWLASKVIINQRSMILDTISDNLSLVDLIRKKIKILLTLPKVLSPSDRVECGIALGYLGDNRTGVGVKNGSDLPDIDWCHIPAGKFQMGLSDEQIQSIKRMAWEGEWIYDDETPSHTVDLPGFYISRYPITVKQYQLFLKADDGYWEDLWWTETGLKLREILESSVHETGGIPDNTPQTNVSWFEAAAYCRWLSHRCGYEIKLPSEAEWEKAARGTDGRFFPWGNDYDPELCNVAETGIFRPCPVGCFPFPNQQFGRNTPLDMCGNVWEWCTTIYQKGQDAPFSYPYKDNDGREVLERTDSFVTITRGGSYTNIPHLARTTFRGRDRPSFKPPRQGFRVVKYMAD